MMIAGKTAEAPGGRMHGIGENEKILKICLENETVNVKKPFQIVGLVVS